MALDLPDGTRGRPPNDLHEETTALAEASHRTLDQAELLEAFAGCVAEALSADLAQILEYIPEDGSFILRTGRGFPEEIHDRARVPDGLLSQAGRAMLDPHGRPVVLEDFSKPHDWADEELIVAHGARSGVAVKVKKGVQDYGALCIFYTVPRQYGPAEVDFLRRAAAFLGSGLERLQRHEAAVAWCSRAELLRAGAALTRVPTGRDDLLSTAALAAVSGGAGGSRPMADWCFADALETNGGRPKIWRVAVDHAEGAALHIKEVFSVPLASTARHGAPRVYATRQPELVDHIDAAFSRAIARDPDHRQAVEEVGPLSYVCAPVIGRERFYGALGFLRVKNGTPVAYDKADLDACAEFATLVGTAIDAGLPHPDIEEAREAVRVHGSEQTHVPTPVEAALNNPTAAERNVLERLAAEMDMHEICRDLSIEESTYKTHRRHIREKLDLKGYCQTMKIVSEARRRGWLPD